MSDILINCHKLNNPIPLDTNILFEEEILKKRGYDLQNIVHVENGITIRELNDYLDTKNLAFENMGDMTDKRMLLLFQPLHMDPVLIWVQLHLLFGLK